MFIVVSSTAVVSVVVELVFAISGTLLCEEVVSKDGWGVGEMITTGVETIWVEFKTPLSETIGNGRELIIDENSELSTGVVSEISIVDGWIVIDASTEVSRGISI